MKKKKKEFYYILLAIVIIICFYVFLYSFSPRDYIYYKGYPIKFRRNINMARGIEVKGCNIRNMVLNPVLKEVVINYFTNDTAKNLIGVEAFEIAYKLNLLYRIENFPIVISGKNVKNISSIKEINFSNFTLNILLISPLLSNSTDVYCEKEKNYIVIRGKDLMGFDLATIKFLLSAFGKA